ncbi:hypothetical protein OAP56_00505 [Rickettsiaceae bacterium]|nr:hypothetical protein [Rickettsiaceae bacterium]
MYVNNEYKTKDIGVVTFGDPRVFDSKQAKEYNKDLGDKTLRVVQHHHDPVPAGIPGSAGYSHVGCQLRVEPEKGVVHSLSGYKYGVRQLDDKSMVDSKSVSIFYTPSLLLRKLNEKTFGNIQQAVKSIRSHMGSKGWAEKEAQDLRSQKDTKPKMQR